PHWACRHPGNAISTIQIVISSKKYFDLDYLMGNFCTTTRSRQVDTMKKKVKHPVATGSRNKTHLALMLSLGASLMLAAYPALADTVTTPLNIESYGDNGVDESGEKNGAAGDDINYVNEDAFVVANTTTPPGGENSVLYLTTVGGQGVDEGSGGHGGSLTFENTSTGKMSLGGDGSYFYNHIIYAKSQGGAGDGDNDNNDSNGGNAGNGGTINVTNSGEFILSGALGYFGDPFIALRASSVGVTGGNQNNGA